MLQAFISLKIIRNVKMEKCDEKVQNNNLISFLRTDKWKQKNV